MHSRRSTGKRNYACKQEERRKKNSLIIPQRRNLRSEKRDTNMGDVVGFKGDFEWNDLLHLRTTSNSPSPTSFPSTYAYIHSVAINHEPAMSDDSEDSIFQKNINVVVVGFSAQAFVVAFLQSHSHVHALAIAVLHPKGKFHFQFCSTKKKIFFLLEVVSSIHTKVYKFFLLLNHVLDQNGFLSD